ncbi:sensor histidine kinase [Flavobacterium seoulense]|uniref:histidine kinase n=1 Tax=Flavobacterium seoulense TaxID=1492738 RepID=A0A066WVD2_9FLAO|nr:ATP-binding protein [Flavobacterium seoulense]KDN54635.1 integral membrane sensor signal transduction histidine kinase [Flavobacterium seoulense]
MHIKTLILIIINSLIALVIALLSFSSYKQFSSVLNDRILLQLNSIKTLKQNQIEHLLKSEWERFEASQLYTQSIDTTVIKLPDSIKTGTGIYDLTAYHVDKKTTIGFISTSKRGTMIKILDYNKIKQILLERTGMGDSGESYLVGEDFRMRSQSRFYPNKIPYTLFAKTKGAANAFKEINGRGVFKDYRGIDVYSVYSLITVKNLKLVILSEMDVDEVTMPLKELKERLLGLTLAIFLLAVMLSLFLIKIITNPIKNMQKSLKIMAEGDYNQTNEFIKNSSEITEMFEALANLKASLQGAVKFSDDIGKMNLNTNFKPKSANDMLGKSLLAMRDKLIEFRNNEENTRILSKRMLVNGMENERRRLSRELHDGIGPYLTSLKHYIENRVEDELQKTEMKKIVDATISEIRLMSNALMPASIDDFGIGVTLTNFIESLKKSTTVTIEYEDLTQQESSNITNHQAINLFRICQELINNSLKHAQAKNIRITLSEFDEFVSLFYFDDGIGFDINTVKLGLGIINIKERVAICNGTITINAIPGNTSFEIELPIEL